MCVWSIEADIFDFDDSEIMDFVYCNADVNRFMTAKDSMGIAACKGMGKTFLLKAKRLEMMKDKSILILPKDSIVDVSGTIAIESMQINFLSSYSNWVSLWISCIAIYLLSQDNFSDIIDEQDMEYLPLCVNKLLKTKNTGIFNVLHKILSLKSKEKLNEVVHASTLLFDYVQRIQQQVVIFVDKLEEPFNRGYYSIPGSTAAAQGRYNASIWSYSQLSFAEAVYTLYSKRHHIKIFYSIRKEALYHGEQITIEYPKLRSRIVSLKYSPEELYNMFCLYISREKEEELSCPEFATINPIKALVGMDKIKHRSGYSEESVWDYIYRHTFQRPRDIMEMCEAIHRHIVKAKKSCTYDEKIRLLRRWVNEISTMECMSYLSFLEPFMSREDNILFKQKIIEFAKTLPMNIFTQASTEYFCHLYNHNKQEKTRCTSCENIHFFSTLYNIGLLGYIHKGDKSYEMRIKHIGESTFDSKHQSLPSGVLYYLHPGFGNIVQQEREISMQQYIPCKYIVNNQAEEIPVCQVRQMVDSVVSILGNMNERRIFITSTGLDLSDERKKIKKLLEMKGYDVKMYEEPDFPQLKNTYENSYPGAAQDHCIDVMMTCKHLIYIFSGRYGDKYIGQKYKTYYEREEAIDEIPSVSFMEYLVAKVNGKNVKVYVNEKVDLSRGEYIANGQPKNYKSQIVENNKVYKLLGYFNDLGNGTWYDKYSNTVNLEEFIDAQF